MTLAREGLVTKFEDKEYRDSFVAEQIFSRLPLKIRSIRETQELTQQQLGKLADMAQTWVSKLEDPNYGKLTVATLLKLASAFDVGLQIDFVPFSRILDDSLRLSAGSFVVAKFADDPGFHCGQAVASGTAIGGTIISLSSYAMEMVSGDAPPPPKSASSIAQQRTSAA